jgi:hypothetical protein
LGRVQWCGLQGLGEIFEEERRVLPDILITLLHHAVVAACRLHF